MTKPPLLEVRSLTKHFPVRRGFLGMRGHVAAVDGVDFVLGAGESLLIVGESGCGKSTLGRLVLRLLAPTGGEVLLRGRRIDKLSPSAMRPLRKDMQIVFQDPFGSLDPRMTVRSILRSHSSISDLQPHRARSTSASLISSPRYGFPRTPCGGSRMNSQAASASASALRARSPPGASLIVCDEAVSALDVSVKAQIINLLSDLQDELRLALLFISHDLAVVEHLTNRVAVMYLGKIVEIGGIVTVFDAPRHPYTQALLSAVPTPDPKAERRRIVLKGEVPSATNPPKGCRFHTRCPFAFDRCRSEEPMLRPTGTEDTFAACHLDALPAQDTSRRRLQ